MSTAVFLFVIWGNLKIPGPCLECVYQERMDCEITGIVKPVTRKSRRISITSINGRSASFDACILTDQPLEDGQNVTAFGRFGPLPFSTNPHQFDYGRFLLENSMNVVFYCDSLIVTGNNHCLSDLTRNRIRRLILEEFSDDSALASFALAVSIGDRLFIDEETREDFLKSGISHILAISGLHVGIILFIILMAASAVGVPKKASYVVSVVLIFLYLSLTGGHPSVWRATVGSSVFLACLIFERERNPYQMLGIAGTVILTRNPLSLWNAGFLMSFGSVLGLVSFMPPISCLIKQKQFSAPVKYILQGFAVVTIVNICLLPVISVTYGKVFLFSTLANLVVIPILYIFILSLGLFIFFPYFPVFSGAAWTAGKTILLIADAVSVSSPHFRLSPFQPYETVLFVFCLCLLKLVTKKRKFLGCFFAFASVFLAVFFGKRIFFEKSYILFFDVGQGNSCLVHSNEGHNFVIDAGRNEHCAQIIVNYIDLEHSGSVDAVFATHQDKDHVGGMKSVISRLEPGAVFFNGVLKEENSISDYMISAGDRLKELSSDDTLIFGEILLAVLSPEKEGKAEFSGDQNEFSLFMTAALGNCLILLPGDRTLFCRPDFLSYDKVILLISHHGDNRANPLDVIGETSPDMTVISVGGNNPYGHPSKALTEYLAGLKSADFRTDKDGAVKIFLPDLSVKCYNNRSYLWHFSREEVLGK